MKLLLDTQIVIWSFASPDKISAYIREMMEDYNNYLFVSSISFFEIQLKRKLGKLEFDFDLKEMVELEAFKILDLSFSHSEYTIHLPLHHRDPFDRILIAQSIVEKMPLITSDAKIHQYDFQFFRA